MSKFTLAVAVVVLVTAVSITRAEPPDYQQTVLQSIYPAGAARGQTVQVTLRGTNDGLAGATKVLVEGSPGITVSDIKPAGKDRVSATFHIAKDAAPGRRMVRVKGGATGLTNFRWFFVGALAEVIESEKNNDPATAEVVPLPIVVNGRVDPTLDQDCFRFEARAGQKIVAAIASHELDAMGYGRKEAGFSDTSLELLDESGAVIAEAGDTLGFDPLLHVTIPQEGWYTVRVSGMGYKGFPNMVYRLTLGEVPYPTAIMPLAGRRGETIEVEFSGPNVPPGTRQSVTIGDDPFPVQYVTLAGTDSATRQLPLLRVNEPTLLQTEPTSREAARTIPLNSSISGRFDKEGEKDWYRLELTAHKLVALEITAQRHLRSPVDVQLEVFDSEGKQIARNDDGAIFLGECTHDFVSFDSYLLFAPKTSGEFFVCVSEQSGAAGPRATYLLEAKPGLPDFRLFQWPDVLPIWGPGGTSACVVEIHRLAGLKADVELSVEGLPPGWRGSVTTATMQDYRPPNGAYGHKLFLTITAPADANVGDTARFRIVGRTKVEGREVMRTAQCLTQYAWGQPNRFRISSGARAIVGPPRKLRFEAAAKELTATPGGTVEIPIKIHRLSNGDSGEVGVAVNLARGHFQCALGSPVKLAGNSDEKVPLKLDSTFKPGTYSIVVAGAWTSETRKGLPGPCTELITLHVKSDE